MTAAHASTSESLRSRVWTAVLAWALAKDNAKTDFAAIGVLNFAVGMALACWPGLTDSRALVALFGTLPRPAWAAAFLVAGTLVFIGLALDASDTHLAGRIRHWAWVSVGTLGVMWLAGLVWAMTQGGGNLAFVLFAVAAQTWYTLTLLRLELPRVADRLRRRASHLTGG